MNHPKRPLSIAPVRDHDKVFELVAPYSAWKARRLPEPSTAPLAAVADGLVAIVAAEGPMLDHRAFHTYTRAAGLGRAGRLVAQAYAKALKRELKSGRLVADPDDAGADEQVLRVPAQPLVALRERGDRTLEEVPLGEITALIRKLELERGEAVASPEERFRRVLGVYELTRLTGKAKARLERACVLAALPRWQNTLSSNFEPEAALKIAKPRRTIRRLRHG